MAQLLPIAGDANNDSVELGWQERALCAETDPEAFFPEKAAQPVKQSGCASPVRCVPNALNTPSRMMSVLGSGAVYPSGKDAD